MVNYSALYLQHLVNQWGKKPTRFITDFAQSLLSYDLILQYSKASTFAKLYSGILTLQMIDSLYTKISTSKSNPFAYETPITV